MVDVLLPNLALTVPIHEEVSKEPNNSYTEIFGDLARFRSGWLSFYEPNRLGRNVHHITNVERQYSITAFAATPEPSNSKQIQPVIQSGGNDTTCPGGCDLRPIR